MNDVWSSTDATTWTSSTGLASLFDDGHKPTGIGHNGDAFVGIVGPYLISSTDAITWSTHGVVLSSIYAVANGFAASDNGVFVVDSYDPGALKKIDWLPKDVAISANVGSGDESSIKITPIFLTSAL